jgi:capsular exopolysaccharide synthesis family protein
VATLAVSLTTDKTYDATSRLVFRDPGLGSAVTGGSQVFPSSTDPEREAATNTELVRSTEVAQLVVNDLSLDETADELLDSVTISDEENTDIVEIKATETSPRLAAAIANSFAENYVSYRRKSDREKVKEAERLLSDRLKETPEGSPERADLEDAMRTLVLLESVQTGNAEVVDAATPPTSASSPTPLRDAVLALIFGLLLGVSLALVLDLLDRRVKSIDDFERLYGLRALAAIPQRLFGRPRTGGSVAEPFLILRSAVDYRSSWDAITVILVTSAGSAEGKTTVAVNLARSLALGGQKVSLIDADMRRPGIERFIDVGPVGPGLSTALAMDTPVTDDDLVADSVAPKLRVLPSGPLPPDPAELVRRRRMGDVIDHMSSESDVVIIDTPPLLPVADTLSLLNMVQIDTVLVVARAYQTTRQDISRARAILKRHEAEPLGLVICGVRDRPGYYEEYRPPVPAREGEPTATSQDPQPAQPWPSSEVGP